MYNYKTQGVTVSEDLTPIKSILTKVSPKIFNHVTSEKNPNIIYKHAHMTQKCV